MLSEVPEGWSELPFGELTSIVGGTTPKKNVAEYWDSEDVLWATPTDITSLPEASHFLSDTATKASVRAVERGGLKLLPANTVLMTSRATIGYVAIAKSEMSTNQGFANFLPSEKYVPLFLLYLLQSKKEQFVSSAGGSTFKEISKGVLKSLSALLPPLNEQHRIAEILSSVDASIQATQAVIEQAERVKRGLMEELLTGGLGSEAIERGEVPEGWEETTIGAVCEIARGGSPRPIDKFMTDAEDGINWIKIGDASASSKYIYTTKEKIKPEGEKKSRRVHSGDFLLSNSMSFGRPYILRTDGCIHDGWLSLSFDRQALGEEFLYYLLSSPLVFNQFSDKAAGSAVKNLNKDLVSSVKIALPPYEEQKRIEEILGDLDALMLSQRTLIEQQNRTKRGLMDDLLTGKVRTV